MSEHNYPSVKSHFASVARFLHSAAFIINRGAVRSTHLSRVTSRSFSLNIEIFSRMNQFRSGFTDTMCIFFHFLQQAE